MTTTAPSIAERAIAAREQADQLEAEASRLATEADTADRALHARRQPVYDAASKKEAAAILAARNEADALGKAEKALSAAIAEPAVNLTVLFDAYQALKIASAVSAKTGETAGHVIDGEPTRHGSTDRFANLAWANVVDSAIQRRVSDCSNFAGLSVTAQIGQAGSDAAAKIQ
jgi:hypothetical protein